MLIKTVTDTINEYGMINAGDTVMVALSGGADSVCLLHVLNELKSKLNVMLEAVHINHCIRGAESDEDEAFCKTLCQKLDIPIKIYRIDVPALAKTSGKSLEETARDARYEKFSEYPHSKIATAHTLSDNAETVIFNMIRGSGIKGLCGIPPVRENIIRPLTAVTREQVEEYLNLKGQIYKTDSTNLSDEYTRNKIRHKIIPVMLEINNGFFKSFANSQKAVKEENTFIEQMALNEYSKHLIKGSLNDTRKIPAVLRKRVILKFLSDNNLPVSFDKINKVYMLSENDGKLNISKNCFVVSNNGRITIERKINKQNINAVTDVPLKIGTNNLFKNISLEFSENPDGKYVFDMDKVSGKLTLHSRRNGDKIKLSGNNFTSSVKKLLNEKVLAEKRQFIHFISDENGLIFMEDFGIADRVKVDENTTNPVSVCINTKKGV